VLLNFDTEAMRPAHRQGIQTRRLRAAPHDQIMGRGHRFSLGQLSEPVRIHQNNCAILMRYNFCRVQRLYTDTVSSLLDRSDAVSKLSAPIGAIFSHANRLSANRRLASKWGSVRSYIRRRDGSTFGIGIMILMSLLNAMTGVRPLSIYLSFLP
jgi:hypothetical protein